MLPGFAFFTAKNAKDAKGRIKGKEKLGVMAAWRFTA
jgi:hypothetical protein